MLFQTKPYHRYLFRKGGGAFVAVMAVIIIALLYLANFSVAIVGVIIVAALYHFYMVDWINLKSGFTQPLLYLQWYFFNNINYQTPEGIHLGGIRVHYKLSQSHKNNDTTNVNGITLSILNFLERTFLVY